MTPTLAVTGREHLTGTPRQKIQQAIAALAILRPDDRCDRAVMMAHCFRIRHLCGQVAYFSAPIFPPVLEDRSVRALVADLVQRSEVGQMNALMLGIICIRAGALEAALRQS